MGNSSEARSRRHSSLVQRHRQERDRRRRTEHAEQPRYPRAHGSTLGQQTADQGDQRTATGQGPGELEQAESLVIGPGDTILVHGRWAPRVNLLAPDGSPAGTFRLQRQSGFPIWYHGTSAGVIAVQLRPATAGRVSAPDPMDGIVILSTKALMSDTLMTFA